MKTCVTCQHFSKNPDAMNGFMCVRFPPTAWPIIGQDRLGQVGLQGVLSLRPGVKEDNFCGEHELREAVLVDFPSNN